MATAGDGALALTSEAFESMECVSDETEATGATLVGEAVVLREGAGTNGFSQSVTT
jgi:hypothetical protein